MTLGVLRTFFGGNALPNLRTKAIHRHCNYRIVTLVKLALGVNNHTTVQFRLHGSVSLKSNQKGDSGLRVGAGPNKAHVALVSRDQ